MRNVSSKEFNRKNTQNKTVDKKKIYSLIVNQDVLSDYFKNIVSANLFASNALEAYLNMRIENFKPSENDYLKLSALIKKDGLILKAKRDLIRECSIQDKLLLIIPYILKNKGISYKLKSSLKLQFKLICSIRNELTHYKRLENRSPLINGKIKCSKLWNSLIPVFINDSENELKYKPAATVKNIINGLENKFNL